MMPMPTIRGSNAKRLCQGSLRDLCHAGGGAALELPRYMRIQTREDAGCVAITIIYALRNKNR
jgi:hypothetical protein